MLSKRLMFLFGTLLGSQVQSFIHDSLTVQLLEPKIYFTKVHNNNSRPASVTAVLLLIQ